MKVSVVILSIAATLLLGTLTSTDAFAQFQGGGVDKEGTWYAGEGLKHGDYFSYSTCHVDYKECVEFEIDLWIKEDITVGSETVWLTEVVVYDGNKIVVGEMNLAKVAPEPISSSDELKEYRSAFKSSIVWLSAFATSDDSSGGKGPKKFSATSWGKIGNIGGEQVVPKAIEIVTVPAGTWETVQIGWKTGGVINRVWVVDDFPFPIKAETYTHVSEGIPPLEYKFELLEYRQGVETSPFVGIESTKSEFEGKGCEIEFDKNMSLKKSTVNFGYQVHVFYGPDEPVQDCPMEWFIKFIRVYDDTEFLNQIQFDFLAVDEKLNPIRSVADEEGRPYLYAPAGQYTLDLIVREPPGTANYVIWIYGMAPEGIVPSTPIDYLKIPVEIFANDTLDSTSTEIPAWVKTNAGWWAEDTIDDGTFVQGIQFLITQEIIKIPHTSGTASDTAEIPPWIKNSAGWWADGQIDDDAFVQGLQFLITEGILVIP